MGVGWVGQNQFQRGAREPSLCRRCGSGEQARTGPRPRGHRRWRGAAASQGQTRVQIGWELPARNSRASAGSCRRETPCIRRELLDFHALLPLQASLKERFPRRKVQNGSGTGATQVCRGWEVGLWLMCFCLVSPGELPNSERDRRRIMGLLQRGGIQPMVGR